MPRPLALRRPSAALAVLVLALLAAFAGPVPAQEPGRSLTQPLALEAARTEIDGPVTLRPVITVDAPYVRLSDIFENLPADRDTVVAPSPRPGQQSRYDVDWLRRTAAASGVAWRPVSRYDSLTVVRDSRRVGRSDIAEALRPYLVERGMPAQAEVALNTAAGGIHIETVANAAIGVLEAQFETGTNRFTALVEIPAGDPQAQRHRLTGRTFLTTAVPVLVETVRHGTVIEPQHIDYITLRVDQLKRDTVTDPEQLIGHTPRRFVQAGTPVLGLEIERPRLVDKGSVVTMVYQTPYLRLTSQGRALDHGGIGDQIRVQNMHSNATVTATITDHNRVTVRPGAESGQ